MADAVEVQREAAAAGDGPPRARATLRPWLALVLVVGAVAGGIVVARRTVFAPRPVVVRTVAVERGRVERSIANSKAGSVRARRQAKLAPSSSGTVAELCVRRGDRVAAGALLLCIEDSVPRASLARAERSLDVLLAEQSRACLVREHAARELARNRELAAEGLVSEDLIDDLQNALDVAAGECAVLEANVARGRTEIDLARAELEHTRLVAPFDGVVAEVSTEVGEWIAPAVGLLSMPTVIELYDPGSLYVTAPMDEVDAGSLAAGAPARVSVDSRPGARFDGTIARVAPYVLDVEQQNRTVEIEVELADRAALATLLPGTSADVEVILEARENVLRLPASALLEGGRVLLLEDGRLVERTVRLGLSNWDFAEVVSGLAEDEAVVSSLDLSGVEAGNRAIAAGGGPSP